MSEMPLSETRLSDPYSNLLSHSASVPFTMDVEDPDIHTDGSFVEVVDQVLAWLETEKKPGSFFIVGELAKNYPAMVRRISEQGHELGLHGLEHVPVNSLSEQQFSTDTQKGKNILEDISGKRLSGYRAPMFSITAATPWAPGILQSLGFSYSSSVLPARNPRYSMSDAPQAPFLWPCGLLEMPAPVTSCLGLRLPFLGGIYFRYFPNRFIENALARLPDDQAPWFYCHPYDFRFGKKYIHMRDTPLWVNTLLMLNRRRAFEKMKKLFAGERASITLAELANKHQLKLTGLTEAQ